mgnify:CR=1 FL=1
MNRFLKKVLVYILCIGFISVVISVSVDPYNIYHYNDVRMNSGEMNSRYVKTKYILSHPDKFNSFLFGSSIVGFIHTEQLNDENMHWYNMTYPNGKLAEIKELSTQAETVLLATDDDREGEAISWHLYTVLGLKPENTIFHGFINGFK